jgi:hypothetical protein
MTEPPATTQSECKGISPHAGSPPPRQNAADPMRYRGLHDGEIEYRLRCIHGRLLLRGRLESLLARREIGGLLFEFARRHPRSRKAFESCCQRTVGLSYDEGRRHIKLWVHWDRCLGALERLERQASQNRVALTIPGLRKLLAVAGVVGRRPVLQPPEPRNPEDIDWIESDPLPDDSEALRRMIQRLQRVNRELRERVVILTNDLSIARAKIGQMPKPG